jgi:hypothetical protein
LELKMAFDKLPGNGYKVTVGDYDGEVVKAVKIAGGVEVTIQLNDPDDDRPVGGAPHSHLEASTSYYSAGVPAEDRLAKDDSVVDSASLAAAKNDDKDASNGAPVTNAPGEHPVSPEKDSKESSSDDKAQAAKPSAVSKPAATRSTTK